MFLLRILLQLIKGHPFLRCFEKFFFIFIFLFWGINLGPYTSQACGVPTTELHPQLSSFLNKISIVFKKVET